MALRDGYGTSPGASCRSVGIKVVADGAMFQRGGDPDRLPRPDGHGRPRATWSRSPIAELVRADARLPRAAGAALGLTYDQLYGGFRWQLPAQVNIGVDVCDRQPPRAPQSSSRTGARTRGASPSASSRTTPTGSRTPCARKGFGDGRPRRDRPTAAARDGASRTSPIYKLGAIAVPLSTRFGPDAIGCESGSAPRDHRRVVLARARASSTVVETIDVDRDLPRCSPAASDRFEPVATAPDTPAMIVYTSGTTGPPKGALHGTGCCYGHLPGFELSHDFFPQPGDLIWTPADWAWIGGLFDVLMPGLYHGVPVSPSRTTKFDPELAFDLIARLGVRNVFIPRPRCG